MADITVSEGPPEQYQVVILSKAKNLLHFMPEVPSARGCIVSLADPQKALQWTQRRILHLMGLIGFASIG